MHRLLFLVALGSWIGCTQAAELRCDVTYDSRNNSLSIPCLNIFGDTNSYAAFLRDTGGLKFSVEGRVQEWDLVDPDVSSLRIVTAPIPIAVIVGESHRTACWFLHHRPTFVQSGNNIDIQIKLRIPGAPLISIADCALPPPFAEAVHLVGVTNPMAHTYSINGIAIAPNFSF
jgi:hypothetical protein